MLTVAVIRPQGDEHIGFTYVGHDHGGDSESLRGLLESIPRHTIRKHADGLKPDSQLRTLHQRRGTVVGCGYGSRSRKRLTPGAKRRGLRRLTSDFWLGRFLDHDLTRFIPRADLGRDGSVAQEQVDSGHDVSMDGKALAVLDLDEHVEGRRRASFEDGLLRTAAAGFFIGESHRFDTADKVAEGWVEQKVIEGLTVRRTDELHAAFRNGARGKRFELAPDLVDDDDFGVVILHGFDHHLVLKHRLADLHAARLTHSRMRHITVTANFVGGIDDDNAFVLSQNARSFAQESGLTHARSSEDEHGLARFDDVLNDVHGAVDGATDAAG